MAQGGGPWKDDSYVDGILNHPRHKPEAWCKEATIAYIQYCIDNADLLRREREEVRARVEKMLKQIDALAAAES